MSKLLEKCRDYDVDVDGVMDRFMDDEELFENCLKTFSNDEHFGKLGEAIKENRYKDAFECIHTLKGVAANLGLKVMYQTASDLTEQLRKNNYDGLDEKYEIICQEQERMKELTN